MPLDDADKKYIADLLASFATSDGLKKTVGEAAKAHIDSAVKPVTEKLEAAEKAVGELKSAKPADKADDKGKDGKGKEGDSETDKKLAQIQAQLAASEKARVDSEEARKADAVNTATRDALAKAGVPADRLGHVLPYLQTKGVITVDKDGKAGWKGKDKYGVDTTLSLEEGAKGFLATDEGKMYLPPSNAQGTGTGPGSGSNGRGGSSGTPKTLDKIDLSPVLAKLFEG